MSYTEFAEYLWDHTYVYTSLADEQYWDGFDAKVWLKVTQREAEKTGVRLSDLESFDYEDTFYDMYQSSEKGLS